MRMSAATSGTCFDAGASGIAGTMVVAGAGLHLPMLYRIATAWLLTLPITILIAGGLYYLLAGPGF
jgi:inorganic phosphate transporter, PiT family